MESPDIAYKNKINILTEWLDDLNKLYFSYRIKASAPQSSITRWNSISLQQKQQVIDAMFTIKISPFYSCASKYKTVSPPCVRKKINNKNGYVDCMDGIISEIELSCRQANAPDYCRKVFLPYVPSNSSCSDEKRKTIDSFVEWLFRSSSDNFSYYDDVLQKRYMANSSIKNSRWK